MVPGQRGDRLPLRCGQRERFGYARTDPVNPSGAAGPQSIGSGQQAQGRFGQGMQATQPTTFRGVDAVGAGHQHATAVHRQGWHREGQRRSAAAVNRQYPPETAVLQYQQAQRSADPEPAAVVGQQRLDVAVHAEGVARVVAMEAYPVEAGQPGLGTEPQVTIRVLGHGQHADLRQPLLHVPAVDDVVGERLVGFQGDGGHRHGQRQQQQPPPQQALAGPAERRDMTIGGWTGDRDFPLEPVRPRLPLNR